MESINSSPINKKETHQIAFSYKHSFLSHKSSLSPSKLSELTLYSPNNKSLEKSIELEAPIFKNSQRAQESSDGNNTPSRETSNPSSKKSRFFSFIPDPNRLKEFDKNEPRSGRHIKRAGHRVNTSFCSFSDLPSFLQSKNYATANSDGKMSSRQSSKEAIEREHKENKEILDSINLFEGLSDSQRYEMAANMKLRKFVKGDIIVEAGLMSDCIYILRAGRIVVLDDDENFLQIIGPGGCFGENLLFSSRKQYKTIVDSDVAECLTISETEISRHLGKDLNLILTRHLMRKILGTCEVTAGL